MISLPLAFGMPGAPEWVFIGILALILFGPKKIPEIARGLGKALGELQRAKEDFHRELTGVPPLPKIESPRGLQSIGSANPNPVDASSSPHQETGVTPAQEAPVNRTDTPKAS
jgi:sec-independent protein translocase protein TatA